MKRTVLILLGAVMLLTGCSRFEGQTGKAVDTFTDKHGRNCTTVKWGESASIDCDYPQEN